MAKQNELDKIEIVAPDILVTTHLYIATYLARKYSRSSAPFDDLYQEGCIGLIKASTKFDPSKGFKFSTYATWWVKQAIFSSLTSSTRTIRLPSHIVQLKLKLFKYSEYYINEFGKEPSVKILAEHLEIPIEKVVKLKNLQLEVDLEDFETFITSKDETALDLLEQEEDRKDIIASLSNLTIKEKVVIGLQYGILSKIK